MQRVLIDIPIGDNVPAMQLGGMPEIRKMLSKNSHKWIAWRGRCDNDHSKIISLLHNKLKVHICRGTVRGWMGKWHPQNLRLEQFRVKHKFTTRNGEKYIARWYSYSSLQEEDSVMCIPNIYKLLSQSQLNINK